MRVSTIPTVNGESISLRLLSRDGAAVRVRAARSERGAAADDSQSVGATERYLPCHRADGLWQIDFALLLSLQHQLGPAAHHHDRGTGRVSFAWVSQIDVKPEIDLTFAKGLRHILRQDPNVVMVGEIRDFETADIAIRAAMTGHLVFSTLHTNDAVGGITRLLDMVSSRSCSRRVVKAFIAQRLVRTICPELQNSGGLSGGYLGELGVTFPPDFKFYRGTGCDHCRQTGYQGRVAIYEICLVTEPLRRLILQKRDGSELKQCAIAQGMETLRHDGWRRVGQGITTIEEVVRVTQTDEVMAETTLRSVAIAETTVRFAEWRRGKGANASRWRVICAELRRPASTFYMMQTSPSNLSHDLVAC